MRKQITVLMLGIGALGLVGSGGAALAQDVIELKVSMFSPPSNTLNKEFVKVARDVEEKSKGRLKLALFHTSQLGPPPRQYDLVRTGVADMAYILGGLTPGRFPLSDLAIAPGVSPSALVGGRAMLEVAEDTAKEFPGVRLLAPIPVSPNPIFTKNEIRRLADLKGLRIRHPGPLQAAAIAAIGAVPVAVQPAEVGDALARGQIDGLTAGYGGVTSFKWQESVRYFVRIHVGSGLFAVIMNPDSYAKLPDDLKKVVDEVIAQPDRWNRAVDEGEAADRNQLLGEGVKEVVLNDADKATYDGLVAKLWDEMIADMEKKGLPARAYFTKLRAAIAKNANAK